MYYIFPFYYKHTITYLISFLLQHLTSTISKSKTQNNNHNSTCMFLTTHFTLHVCPFRPQKFHPFIEFFLFHIQLTLIFTIEHTVAGYKWLSQEKQLVAYA